MKPLKAEIGFYVFQAFPDGFRHGGFFLLRIVGAGIQNLSRRVRHMNCGSRPGIGRNTIVPLASDIRTEDMLWPPPETLPMGGMGI